MALNCQAFYFTIILSVVCGLESNLLVQTKSGAYEGSLDKTGQYYEFLGIRYGIPVRFRAPIPPPSFSGVYKADNRAVLCPQFPTHDPLCAASDNEDCLVLNIYTPPKANATLPVMFFIHGGGFSVGSGSPTFYGAEYLTTQDVILVTVNYRLNAYGFLNLEIREAPGNAGLKDIRAALRWVKENIAYFNGDPDNVTVFGEGSGGTAAIYLTLSTSTKGLFHRIISQSGTLFSPESFDAAPLKTASQVAKCLSVNTLNPKKLLHVYTNTSIDMVEEAIRKQMHAKSIFLPSVEKEFECEEAFLTDDPYTIITKKLDCFNPVPIIIGINTVEGLTCILDYNTITSQMDRIKHEDYSVIDQRNFRIDTKDKDDIRNLIVDTYFTNTTSEESLIGGLINLNTDFSYVGPLSLFTELYVNASGLPCYQYIFSHVGNRNLGRLLTNSSLEATANRDELFYIFELERLPLPLDEDDFSMVNFMTTMWSNFAKFGTPTPDTSNGEWIPFPHHLDINLEPQYVAPLTPERAEFWRYLFLKYGVNNDN